MSARQNTGLVRSGDLIPNLTRRQFTQAGLGTLALAGLSAAVPALAQTGQRRVMHLIGHSHIDAAWLWPWTDASDLVLTTFRSALDRMKETPGFRYTHSSAVHYRWVQQADPLLWEEIKTRIHEGRWEVVGGWPVEPDCNIPSTESFARHCLYGKRYLQQALGVSVDVGFNPDSFGHGAGLPTVLKNAGYKYYIFMRPQEHEMQLPRMFWWEGPDGSRVLAYRIYNSYDWLANGVKEAANHVFPDGFSEGMFFFGVGDHGGAATRAQVQEILQLQNDSTLPELRWSTVHEFFAAVQASPAFGKLPVVRGDLQHHARGCYSARGEQKYLNRRSEHEMYRAEIVATMASSLYGRAYPTAAYVDAWSEVLFNQFHDLLAGSALYSDYESSRDQEGLACATALETRHANLQHMARQVDMSSVPEGVIFVFNPLPWRRTAVLTWQHDSRDGHYSSLKTQDGKSVPLQERPSDSMTNFYPRLCAAVELPPCGYKVVTIERTPVAVATSAYLDSYSIVPNGFGLSSLRASDGTELLAGSLGLVVIEDKSDTWAHDILSFRTEIGRPQLVSSDRVEDGPVIRVTRQHLRWATSTIILEMTESAGIDAVQLRFIIDWNEHEQILKLEIPTNLKEPSIFAKVPGAVLERKTNGEEEPYQDWVAVQGNSDGKVRTVALINAQTYSYDCLDGLLRTILIRSAPYARHNPNKVDPNGSQAWQDQGRQERTFWLIWGSGEHTGLQLDRRAWELQLPPEYVLDSRHAGNKPWEASFFEVMPEQVEVLAVKRAEDGEAIIVRLQERSGAPTRAHVRSPALKIDTEVELAPWQIRTVSLAPGRGKAQTQFVSIMER